MCGLHVYEISKLIMSRNDITWNNLRHLNNNKKARLRVVRELLGSTKFGEHILREVKDDDIRLERVLHDIHYDCQNAITDLSEGRLCKVNKQEDDQVRCTFDVICTCLNLYFCYSNVLYMFG